MDLLQSIQNSDQPLLSAHRGGMTLYPENTMLAFRESVIVHNVDILEFDLQLTKDGKAVVIHDSTLNRTTNGSGNVCDFTYAEISVLDAGYHFSADAEKTYPYLGKEIRIPLFEDVIREFPDTFLNSELKDSSPVLAEEVKWIVEKFNAQKRMLLGSGNYFQHSRIRKLMPDCYHFLSRPDIYLFAFLGSLGRGKKYFQKFVFRLDKNINLLNC